MGQYGGGDPGMSFTPVCPQYEQFSLSAGAHQRTGHRVAGEKFLCHGQARVKLLDEEHCIVQDIARVGLRGDVTPPSRRRLLDVNNP
ncbi:MAG: hypothetical protein K0Q84_1967, partial [Arthrobacter sp.]|nr:hypothetical protein [Arthrobacter sp.]